MVEQGLAFPEPFEAPDGQDGACPAGRPRREGRLEDYVFPHGRRRRPWDPAGFSMAQNEPSGPFFVPLSSSQTRNRRSQLPRQEWACVYEYTQVALHIDQDE